MNRRTIRRIPPIPRGAVHHQHLTEPCARCGETFTISLYYNAASQPLDSHGGIQFDEGNVCNNCLRRSGITEDQLY